MSRLTGIEPLEARSIDLTYGWLAEAFGADRHDFKLAVLIDPRSPWLTLKAKPAEPFDVGRLPETVDLALWRHTGAVHVCIGGEVQEPPVVPPA